MNIHVTYLGQLIGIIIKQMERENENQQNESI